jgi:hypothetical protein
MIYETYKLVKNMATKAISISAGTLYGVGTLVITKGAEMVQEGNQIYGLITMGIGFGIYIGTVYAVQKGIITEALKKLKQG